MEKLINGASQLGLTLAQNQVDLFQTFYSELIEWNSRINLTSIIDYESVQINHFLDALTVVQVWKPETGKVMRVIDVGAGPGIPGIPLKIVFPEIRLTLLEATSKKTRFLEHVKNMLGLTGVEIIAGRAEDIARLRGYRESFDLVLARAVAKMATLAELTLPFCRISGKAIAYKKGDIKAEVENASGAISLLGGKLVEVKPVILPEFTDHRYLVLTEKVAPTPPKYPRRSGIPAKQPLG